MPYHWINTDSAHENSTSLQLMPMYPPTHDSWPMLPAVHTAQRHQPGRHRAAGDCVLPCLYSSQRVNAMPSFSLRSFRLLCCFGSRCCLGPPCRPMPPGFLEVIQQVSLPSPQPPMCRRARACEVRGRVLRAPHPVHNHLSAMDHG